MIISYVVFLLLNQACFISVSKAFAIQKLKNRATTVAINMAQDMKLRDQQFSLGRIAFSLLPLSPESIGKRKTILEEIVPGKVWTLDQLQGIINVNVPVRCTVIKLKQGGLFVHNPVAPTNECISLIRELEAKHGPVQVIVLATLGVEHKGTLGAFASYFPKSEVFVQPDQYSFPVNLPVQLFLPFGCKVKNIPLKSEDAPWKEDLDHICMKTLKAKSAGGYGETAFYHYDTKTLMVTDAIVRVSNDPPPIVQDDPRALLYHARDTIEDVVTDTLENRRKGWRRMVLFGLAFQPSGIQVKSVKGAFSNLDKVPKEMQQLGRRAIPFSEALYPWDWIKSEIPNFKALQGGLLVAPILRALIFNREPEAVLEWVDQVCKWNFERIIPCHLENNLKANKEDFRDAFDFLYEPEVPSTVQSSPFSFNFNDILTGKLFSTAPYRRTIRCPAPLEEDLTVLRAASKALTIIGTLKPVAPLMRRK